MKGCSAILSGASRCAGGRSGSISQHAKINTPYTKSLHVAERYRLRDYEDVKDAVERNMKENWHFAGDVFSRHRGKFLQLHLTIADEGAFTTPWTATLTYVPGGDQLQEVACAENRNEYYYNKESAVPT